MMSLFKVNGPTGAAPGKIEGGLTVFTGNRPPLKLFCFGPLQTENVKNEKKKIK